MSTVNTVIQVLNNKDGKDKTIKLIQYSCKLLLHVGVKDDLQIMTRLASNMSLFRAMMRLGNWLEPSHSISKGSKGEDLVVDALDVCTAICDDIICLKKMGIVKNKRVTAIADQQAAMCWFLAILFNLKNAYRKYKKDPTVINLVSFWKLFCDGMFCAVDVFDIPSELLSILSGFGSGILSYYKLWVKFS